MKALIKILTLVSVFSIPAFADTNPYIGEIILTSANYCAVGTAEARGQILQIKENGVLFSVVGPYFGGDGRKTFALPKLTPPNPKQRYCIALKGDYPMRP